MYFRFLSVFLLLQVLRVCAGINGKTISCVCTTTQCQTQGTTRCNTTGMCYSQFLDRQDGSNPLVRGCITSRTPLLCENRKPAIAADTNWPLLVCCNSNLCNDNVVPTFPTQLASDKVQSSGEAVADLSINAAGGLSSPGGHNNVVGETNLIDEKHFRSRTSSSSSPGRLRFLSPTYIAVIVVGVCTLVVLGAFAAYVLRRNNRFYEAQYGAIERNSYCKHHRMVVPENVEVQLPPPTRTYDNKGVLST